MTRLFVPAADLFKAYDITPRGREIPPPQPPEPRQTLCAHLRKVGTNARGGRRGTGILGVDGKHCTLQSVSTLHLLWPISSVASMSQY